MSFFFSFLSSLVFLQIERERERGYIIGYREKQSYSLLIFSDLMLEDYSGFVFFRDVTTDKDLEKNDELGGARSMALASAL